MLEWRERRSGELAVGLAYVCRLGSASDKEPEKKSIRSLLLDKINRRLYQMMQRMHSWLGCYWLSESSQSLAVKPTYAFL